MAEGRKISVYLCDCGNQLSKALNYQKLVEEVEKWPEVIETSRVANLCSKEGLESMLKQFREEGSERFVVGACTPQRLELRIRLLLEERGTNPYVFDIANLREQCAWVHHDVEKATEKALALLRASVGRALFLEDIEKERYELGRRVIVIGGGISGLQASVDLASLGYDVIVLEERPYLGGHIIKLPKIYPSNIDGRSLIEERIRSAEGLGVKFLRNCEVGRVEGSLGDFQVFVRVNPAYVDPNKCDLCGRCEEVCPVAIPSEFEEELTDRKVIYRPVLGGAYIITRHHCSAGCGRCAEACPAGAIDLELKPETEILESDALVLATGYDLFKPEGFKTYGFGNNPNVITQLQLARMLDPKGPTDGRLINRSNGREVKRVVMVQCVGSRDLQAKSYCSGLCCMFAVRNALEIKEFDGDIDVRIVYTDMRTFYDLESEYREARREGVDFIRGRVGDVYTEDDQVNVQVFDSILFRHIKIPCDLLVLSTALIPNDKNNGTFDMLNLGLNSMGFVRELYPKLRKVDTARRGVYLCGAISGPKSIRDSIAEAHAAALRLRQDFQEEAAGRYLAVTTIDEEKCDGCGLCERICPFKVPLIIEREEDVFKAYIDTKICRGCGTCTSVCPTGAAQLQTHLRDQTIAQIQRLLADHRSSNSPIVVGFICDECAYATADMAGMVGLTYPENIRLIRLPCAGRLSLLDILKTFEHGAQAVFLACCADERCHYLDGETKADIQIQVAKELLDSIGWNSRRIEIFHMFSAEPNKFVEAVEEMNRRVKIMGPTPVM
ncbi:MAG: hydrogenase iron-sulfur subunit [Candidatus Bathyarchaeia archaeon]